MASSSFVQRNLYKGVGPRCWLRLRFAAIDGSLHERELLADTGSPCAVILGKTDLLLLQRASAAGSSTNFGYLTGGWLELDMPELGISSQIHGYGSEAILQAVRSDSSDFSGLAGLPLLRMLECGGDADSFWVRQPPVIP